MGRGWSRNGAMAALLGLCGVLGTIRSVQAQQGEAVYLDTLDLSKMTTGWMEPRANRSIENNPLTLGGKVYEHGVGTHAASAYVVNLKGSAARFLAAVGVDDEKKTSVASVTFEVWVDGKKVFESGVMHGGDAPKTVNVDLTGAKRLTLIVGDAGDGVDSDHADWAEAMILLAPSAVARPEAATIPVDPPRMIVPKPDGKPHIHGPRIVGGSPGKPFLFLVPVSGEGPFTYSSTPLPPGLKLDRKTGIISGILDSVENYRQVGLALHDKDPKMKPNSYEIPYEPTITVRGPKGTARRQLKIVVKPNHIALTPPMGWNSWNVWAGAVDADKVKAAADWMIKSGLAAHGFQYINIDDCWEGQRNAEGEIQTNEKFPDMKALGDYIHSKGLKFGIYSSPGPKTCAGFEASYQHEVQDAKTYAKWGVDYLKYDWCSYGGIDRGDTLAGLQKPYLIMRDGLRQTNRDILYSLCQYGMGDVWKWGAEVDGNCWRTTGDITDTWGSLYGIFTSQDGHEKYAGPGRWNDPDMLIVGQVGWGNPHPSRLTPNEQITHISLWCLLSSPLLIGCDMAKLDDLTIALLSNDEVLDINQNSLGKPAGRVLKEGMAEIWARPLADGTKAVGLVNTGMEATKITVDWKALGIKGRKPVRDLWLHQNVGVFSEKYSVEVPAHGTVLLKIGKGRS